MKVFVRKVMLFSLPVIFYVLLSGWFMPRLLSLSNGPSTKEQIEQSFRNVATTNFDLLVLGNSRTYRGINTDVFTLKSLNFSHDNDSYNQLFYKLKHVFDSGKSFKYLVLGVDYFQFSQKVETRNYVYADYFDEQYMRDFERGVLENKVEYFLKNINPKKLRNFHVLDDPPFLRSNGQYIRRGQARESDEISRSIERLNFQVSYFKRILELCRSRNVKIFLVMLPLRKKELELYSFEETEDFKGFIQDFEDDCCVKYLTYGESEDFVLSDFTDITHLNEGAANRFTAILDKDINEWLRVLEW